MLANTTAHAGQHILIVDDDAKLCSLLAQYLASEGLPVDTTQRADDGATRALSGDYALVILDVMLPRVDGFEVLRRIRAESDVPVVMLTARGEEMNRIVGLELGADDYLAKPFSPRELVARIRAVLRRTQSGRPSSAGEAGEQLVVGDVEMDVQARRVHCGGQRVRLTGLEFNLLAALLRAAGAVVTRERLTREVLGRTLLAHDRSLDMHVSNLRKKLGHLAGGDERIKTIRSVGYIYVVARDAPVGVTSAAPG